MRLLAVLPALLSVGLFCLQPTHATQSLIKCEGIKFDSCPDTDLHEGRIEVPLDWHDLEDSRRLEIKYRIIGYRHTDRPFLFVIGGGPGMASLNYYFLGEWHRGGGLTEHYRIVVFDQRGTGQSSPVDRSAVELTSEIIAKYFSQDQITYDLGFLISEFGKRAEGFDILAHSAGGIVLSQYLANEKAGPRPRSVIFASAITGANPWAFLTNRFKKQIELNKSYMTDEMKQDVMTIRNRIRALNRFKETVPEGMLDALYEDVGTKQLASTLKTLTADLRIEDFIKKLSEPRAVNATADRFMATLSATYFNGQSDLEWAEKNNFLQSQEEDWMLLERRMVKSIYRSEWIKTQIGSEAELQVRLAGRKYNNLATAAQIKESVNHIPSLILIGDKDQYIDDKAANEEFKAIFDRPQHHIEPIEDGNHYSTLSPTLAPFIIQKLAELRDAEALSSVRTQYCDKFLLPTTQTHGPWPFPTRDGKPWYSKSR